jgi:hypothetical protein
MENIATFLNGAEEIGCPKFELFQTIDLYEKKHLNQVSTISLHHAFLLTLYR